MALLAVEQTLLLRAVANRLRHPGPRYSDDRRRRRRTSTAPPRLPTTSLPSAAVVRSALKATILHCCEDLADVRQIEVDLKFAEMLADALRGCDAAVCLDRIAQECAALHRQALRHHVQDSAWAACVREMVITVADAGAWVDRRPRRVRSAPGSRSAWRDAAAALTCRRRFASAPRRRFSRHHAFNVSYTLSRSTDECVNAPDRRSGTCRRRAQHNDRNGRCARCGISCRPIMLPSQ